MSDDENTDITIMQGPTRFAIGCRVRCCPDINRRNNGWRQGVIVKLWHDIHEKDRNERRRRRRGSRRRRQQESIYHPYKVRVSKHTYLSVAVDSDDYIQYICSASEWDQMCLNDYCQSIRSGAVDVVDLSGEIYGLSSRLLSPARNTIGGDIMNCYYEYSVTDASLQQICSAMCHPNSLVRELRLERDIVKHLGIIGLQALARAIAKSRSIHSVMLMYFGNGPEDQWRVDSLLYETAQTTKMTTQATNTAIQAVATKTYEAPPTQKAITLEQCRLPLPEVLENSLASNHWKRLVVHFPLSICPLQRSAFQRGLAASGQHLQVLSLDGIDAQFVHDSVKTVTGHHSLRELSTLRIRGLPPAADWESTICGFFKAQQEKYPYPEEPVLKVLRVSASHYMADKKPLMALLTKVDVLEKIDWQGPVDENFSKQAMSYLAKTRRLEEFLLPWPLLAPLLNLSGYQDIAQGIQRNNGSLRKLNVYLNEAVGDAGLGIMCSALQVHGKVKTLILGSHTGYGETVERARVLRYQLSRLKSFVHHMDVRECFCPASDEIFQEFWNGFFQAGLPALRGLQWDRRYTSRVMIQEAEWLLSLRRLCDTDMDKQRGLWAHVLSSASGREAVLFSLLKKCLCGLD